MSEVFGKTQGLKASQLRRLERLFQRSPSSQVVCEPAFARALAEASADLSRYVGVLASRRGDVEQVILGEPTRLYLPDIGRLRAGAGRLRGLRLIVAKPRANSGNSVSLDGDLITDLERLQLDALLVIEANDDGLPGRCALATLTANQRGHARAAAGGPPALGEGFRDRWIAYSQEGEPVPTPAPAKEKTAARHQRTDFGHVNEITAHFPTLVADLEGELQSSIDQARDAAIVPGERDVAVLVGVYVNNEGITKADAAASMVELTELAKTAGVRVVDTMTQMRDKVDGRTIVGSGKLEEICLRALHLGAEAIIFDRDLSPSQLNSITDLTDLKVLDRTMLILDIFARRAKSREGRMQVELAQLKYSIPRLAKKQTGLSRLTGGIGGQGPGETKLEIDRRRARDKITRLERDIEQFAKERALRRKHRHEHGVPVFALVGYTNAGKSTLLNRLTGADSYAANELFATLDTTTRRLRLPNEQEVVVTDTVGFIRDLPETLINAFRATLDELHDADVLLHVIDDQDDRSEHHITAVEDVLEQLGLQDTPRLLVFNKCEGGYTGKEPRGLRVSALHGEGLVALTTAMMQQMKPANVGGQKLARATARA